MIDLNPHYLETVNAILAEHVPKCEVRAFGSRATWTAKDYSDLDLAVVGKGPLDWKALGRLKEAFEESNLPMRVDVLDWHSISERFRNAIKQDCVILQARRKQVKTDAWRKATLGDCVVINDNTYSPKEKWPFVNYLDTSNITENRIAKIQHLVADKDKLPSRARRKVQSGDIVYSTVRPNQRHFGLIREPSENFLVSTGFATIRGKEGLALTEYVYWFLVQDHIVEHLHAIAEQSTSAYPSIKPSDFERLELDLPPLAEQRRIAQILGALDDKIELNRRMNATLEDMARALFKSWFVDFEPVRAKMQGRWRRGESLPGMPADLWDAFPARLAATELGEAPEGWEVKNLDQFVELNPREPLKKGIEAPYLNMAALPTSGTNPDDAVLREYKSGTRFRNGDTLLARITPCLENGKTAYVQSLPPDTLGWGSTEFVVMRAIPPVTPEYTYLLARDEAFRAYAIQSMTGTSGRQRVQAAVLSTYRLPFPQEEIWSAFSLLAEPMFAKIKATSEESRSLAGMRDALLPGLVLGEVAG